MVVGYVSPGVLGRWEVGGRCMALYATKVESIYLERLNIDVMILNTSDFLPAVEVLTLDVASPKYHIVDVFSAIIKCLKYTLLL